jgi:preprotein translocase subunit YajC
MPNLTMLALPALLFFMMYFVLIKPQKKLRAQQTDLLAHLETGAEVRTSSGILGVAVEIGEDFVVIESTPGTRLKVVKQAIAGIILTDEPEDEAEDEPSDGVYGESSATVGETPTAVVRDAVPAGAQTVEHVSESISESVENAVKP